MNETAPIKIYIRWEMPAESWSGQTAILSIHQTLEGALAAMPDDIKKDSLDRTEPKEEAIPGWPYYIKNYTYEAIEEREVEV